jgi:hypothetical protein
MSDLTDVQRIAVLNLRIMKMAELLDAAVCPCCDKSGAYYDNMGEVCQCQWCDEVNKVTGGIE